MEEESYEGRTIERDASGKFVKASLDPETARAMSAQAQIKKKSKTIGNLLEEAGYTDENEAPKHLKILAEIAASKKSGAVSALRDFRRLVNPGEGDPKGPNRPKAGERCPLCGQWSIAGMSGHGAGEVVRLLRRVPGLPGE